MGRNFSALIHYPGPIGNLLGVIADLERGLTAPELRKVVEVGRRLGFAFAEYAGEAAVWRSLADWERVLVDRPDLPCLGATLALPSGFSLTFGEDAVWVTHYLRWMFFVTESEWWRVMLEALRWFCRSLDANDCIVTYDENPIVQGFQEGSTYRSALQIAVQNGGKELRSIFFRYADEVTSEELGFFGGDGKVLPIRHWDSFRFWPFDFRGS